MVSATSGTGSQILEGAKALEATLKGMKFTVQRRIMRNSVNRALTVVAREIRKSVPAAITRGHNMNRRVKKSIGVRGYKSRPDQYAGKTGLRVGSSRNATIAPHAHWVALGTGDRRTKSGAFRGRVQPRSFVPAAFSRSEPKAVEEMRKTFKKQLEKEIEKQARKNRSLG